MKFRNAPAAPCIITLLVDDGSTKKPLIVTRQVVPSEPPIIQQIDLVQEATYRIRAAVLWPDRQTLRLSAVAAVQNVRVASASTSSIDLLFTPVALSVQLSSSGGNEIYSVSLDDTAAFFCGSDNNRCTLNYIGATWPGGRKAVLLTSKPLARGNNMERQLQRPKCF